MTASDPGAVESRWRSTRHWIAAALLMALLLAGLIVAATGNGDSCPEGVECDRQVGDAVMAT